MKDKDKTTEDIGKFGNELYNVFDKEPSIPMTMEELRGRLKHIATLCVGLSIDLSNEIKLREDLEQENEKLRKALNKPPRAKNMTEIERARQREYQRKYYRNRVEKEREKKRNDNGDY